MGYISILEAFPEETQTSSPARDWVAWFQFNHFPIKNAKYLFRDAHLYVLDWLSCCSRLWMVDQIAGGGNLILSPMGNSAANQALKYCFFCFTPTLNLEELSLCHMDGWGLHWKGCLPWCWEMIKPILLTSNVQQLKQVCCKVSRMSRRCHSWTICVGTLRRSLMHYRRKWHEEGWLREGFSFLANVHL